MILLIDNYDSFTYNLYHLFTKYSTQIHVVRNDEITIEEIQIMKPDAIVFSPGPGKPKDAGHMEAIIQPYYQSIPMLGICLGHQAIAEVFHANITFAKEILHGVQDTIHIVDHNSIFKGMKETISAARYHSLIVEDLPWELEVLAVSKQQEIMAIRHRNYPVYGIQFHPESILTPLGDQIIENFMKERKLSC